MSKFNVRTFFKKNSLPSLIKRLEIAKSGMNVTIGVHEKEGSVKKESDGATKEPLKLVEVATFHEFGTENITQRSFIRANDADNYRKYKQMIAEIKDKIIFNEFGIAQGLGLLGEAIRADIQRKIRSGISPALKPSTIARKGSSTPLIDTGQLINGITYKVNEGKK